MFDAPPTMTEFDVRRLDALCERIRRQVKPPPTPSALERELDRAVLVKPEAVPATVVTMNSRVELLDLETKQRRCITLVFPAMAGIDEGRLSVLAPLGTALLGSREGNQVTWTTPGGVRRLEVTRIVYQPGRRPVRPVSCHGPARPCLRAARRTPEARRSRA